MKYLSAVEVVVEKERYTKHGVHKGMQGWITEEESVNKAWLVNFPQYGAKADIATISVKEEDLKELPNGMNAHVNERIKAEFGD